MKKFKVGLSFLLLVVVCLLTKNLVLMFNYLLALFLHEIAHLWVAEIKGYSLKQIKLDAFGLAVDLNEKIDNEDQFVINIAGPICNLLLCILCLATYWLFPISFCFFNTFCFCNLVLAIFNLIPVYPLDGGKIFCGIIKSEKVYKILDRFIRCLLAVLFIGAFVVSCFNTPNLFLLALGVFFIVSKANPTPTMSIFKYRTNKHFDKVVILKVEETETLFNLIKQIKSHYYTIFYVPQLKQYYDEDMVIDLSLRNDLTKEIKDIVRKT